MLGTPVTCQKRSFLVALAFLVFVSTGLLFAKHAVSQSSLPPEVQRDVLVVKLTDAMKEKRFDDALTAIDELRELGVTLPSSIGYFEAEAASGVGNYIRAEKALTSYLSMASKDDPTYQFAIRLYSSVDADAKKQRESVETFFEEDFTEWVTRELSIEYRRNEKNRMRVEMKKYPRGFCPKNTKAPAPGVGVGVLDRCKLRVEIEGYWYGKYKEDDWEREMRARNMEWCYGLFEQELTAENAMEISRLPNNKHFHKHLFSGADNFAKANQFSRILYFGTLRDLRHPASQPLSGMSTWVYLTEQEYKAYVTVGDAYAQQNCCGKYWKDTPECRSRRYQ